MAQEKIQLRKIRDFGEVFSDTFQYIKQEFKPLLIAFTIIGLSFVILDSILLVLYRNHLQQVTSYVNGSNTVTISTLFSIYDSTFFLMILVSIVSFAAMFTCIAVYMKYYEEHAVSPTPNQMWRIFFKYFPRTLVLALLTSLTSILGFFFCFFPGFYFAFVFMPYAFIVINEDLSIGQAFSRCFEIIKENFWASAGLYIVLGILIAVLSLLIGVITEVATGASSLFSMEAYKGNPTLDIILNIVQYYFYIVLYVAVGLQYYNLVEKKDGAGLSKRLETLGSNINPNDDIEEQY
jgi:hypothetical protein